MKNIKCSQRNFKRGSFHLFCVGIVESGVRFASSTTHSFYTVEKELPIVDSWLGESTNR